MGIVFGGVLIGTNGAYRTLFVIDAISFVVFFAVIYLAIAETYRPPETKSTSLQGSWAAALRDRRLLIYVLVSSSTYISQLHSALPLYLCLSEFEKGFAESTISALFSWHF